MTGDRAVAEELAQETWIAAWNTRVSYEPRGQFATWLFVAARNRGLNAKRGDARRARVMAHDPDDVAVAKTASDDPSQLDRLIVAEEHARVDQALTELPPAMREAVTLRYAEVLAYEEIGAITGATPSTVRSRVFHGVKKLHAILTGTEEGGSP